MPTYDVLLATKPLPLLPQPAVRYPGPLGKLMYELFLSDRMAATRLRQRAMAQAAIEALVSEATHATP